MSGRPPSRFSLTRQREIRSSFILDFTVLLLQNMTSLFVLAASACSIRQMRLPLILQHLTSYDSSVMPFCSWIVGPQVSDLSLVDFRPI